MNPIPDLSHLDKFPRWKCQESNLVPSLGLLFRYTDHLSNRRVKIKTNITSPKEKILKHFKKNKVNIPIMVIHSEIKKILIYTNEY